MSIKEKIKSNPKLKQLVLNFIMHPAKTRPQWWIRLFQFIYLKKGKGSVIYRSVRKDLVPFNRFVLGNNSVVEDFSCLNNAVGDIIIGSNSRIGLGNTIIGPVQIGNEVNIAQSVTISGLNHNFQDINKTISSQGVSTSQVIIEDDVWIGANSVILASTKIGKHSIIAAGSIVTHSIPSFCVAAGNPAKIIKQYDFEKNEWVRIKT
nr:acyltransferase [uncultured Bacteroides sp.]